MAYDGKVLARARDRYETEKERRRADFRRQRAEIYARVPRLVQIDAQLRGTVSRTIAAALRSGQDPAARVAALKGPTAMGLVELMKASDLAGAGEDVPQAYDNLPDAVDSYTFTLAASATELAPQLVKGDLDIACVPANLAASLYQQTEGQVVTLGINTLGVLYIVENGNAVQSLADLEGKTMVASGKDSTPEYALRYLLEENGVDPDTGVVIDWKNEHSECVSALASGAATIALLPQPFVTVAESKMPELRTALDLTAEWDALPSSPAWWWPGGT